MWEGNSLLLMDQESHLAEDRILEEGDAGLLGSYLNELAGKGIWGQSLRSERWMVVTHCCSICQVG